MQSRRRASQDLGGVVQDLEAFLAQIPSEVQDSLSEIETAANDVGRAWSGSWIGYQSRVYYAAFGSPPAGAHFNSEWGLMSGHFGSSTGEWIEYAYDSVVAEVLRRTNGRSLEQGDAVAGEAGKLFEAKRDEVVSILESLPHRDAFLEGLLEKVKQAQLLTAQQFVRFQMPSEIISRDRTAVSQGPQTPPHVAVLAEILGIRAAFRACETVVDVVTKAAAHIDRLSDRALRDERIGTNVFIGHGRSLAWKDFKDFIQDRLRLPWDEFNRVPVAGVTNVARMSEMLDSAAIAFVVMTAEDERADGSVQARMNVIHEAGLFQGRLGFTRAILLLENGCEEFSNIHGLGQIRFPRGNITAAFEEVRRVLEREGLIDEA